MSGKYVPLTQPQLDVLQWVAEGCLENRWSGHVHKLVARGLANRSLIRVHRVRNRWTATILPAGIYYLAHNAYEFRAAQAVSQSAKPNWAKLRPPSLAPGAVSTSSSNQKLSPPTPEIVEVSDAPQPYRVAADATVRAMRRIARKPKRPAVEVAYSPEEPMKFTVMVTRVQVAQRSVHAADEESAARKVQEEFDRPYGYFGTWKTVGSEVEVTEKESVLSEIPSALSADGSLLLSLKEAGKALGISYSTIYEMVNRGDLEHVLLGSRKYIAREALLRFIEDNTHRGFHD